MKNSVSFSFMMAAALALPGHAATCEALDAEAIKRSIYIPGYVSDYDVIGKGRLQFYSAPDRKCIIAGVFVTPATA